ncbi:MAG: CoA-binding protein [Dermatophilaceae bacterium]
MTGSPHSINDPAVIRDLLTTPATWAVVGLSDNAERTAYRIASFLRDRLGMHVIPVHPAAPQVAGVQGYAALADIPDGTQVTVVDCFVRSELVGEVVDAAIAERDRLGIRAVWLQLGVIDDDAARRALDAGLEVVMDTCPKIEWPKIAP